LRKPWRLAAMIAAISGWVSDLSSFFTQ
jgi:hypothetical protein